MTTRENPRVLVLGIGNILNQDEGVGVYAIRKLQEKYDSNTEFAIHDGGTLGLNLLPLVDDATHLLIIDAVDAAKPAGSIIELEGADIPLFNRVVKMSEHQLSFQEVLGLAMLRGTLPKNLRLIGVQPHDISVGLGLTDVIQPVLDDVLQRAEAIMKDWGYPQPIQTL